MHARASPDAASVAQGTALVMTAAVARMADLFKPENENDELASRAVVLHALAAPNEPVPALTSDARAAADRARVRLGAPLQNHQSSCDGETNEAS